MLSKDFWNVGPAFSRSKMFIKFKAVTFTVPNGKGYYFYEITLPEALAKMKALGIDPITNFKMNIAVYYW